MGILQISNAIRTTLILVVKAKNKLQTFLNMLILVKSSNALTRTCVSASLKTVVHVKICEKGVRWDLDIKNYK